MKDTTSMNTVTIKIRKYSIALPGKYILFDYTNHQKVTLYVKYPNKLNSSFKDQLESTSDFSCKHIFTAGDKGK